MTELGTGGWRNHIQRFSGKGGRAGLQSPTASLTRNPTKLGSLACYSQEEHLQEAGWLSLWGSGAEV